MKQILINWDSGIYHDENGLGVGDFLLRLPAVHYFVNNGFHVTIPTKRFKNLLEGRINNITVTGEAEAISNLRIYKTYTGIPLKYSHLSAGYLPFCKETFGNFYNIENNFIYPFLPVSNLEKCVIREKYFLNRKKPILAILKYASKVHRNWDEDQWVNVIKRLLPKYCIVNLGVSQSPKNSVKYVCNQDVEDLGDKVKNDWGELLVILSLCDGFISVNSSMFHLATAARTKKVCVISAKNRFIDDRMGDFQWYYPSNQVFFQELNGIEDRICEQF